MKHVRVFTYALGGLVWALVPFIAKAQGLVPCGQSTGKLQNGVDVGSISCNLCHVGELFQNGINFLVGVSIPVALIMFGVAGWVMFTSGSSPERHEKGKKIFRSVFIGFIVVVSGWLVIQTILNVLVKDEFRIDDWRSLNCDATSKQRIDQATGSASDVFTRVLSNNVQTGTGSAPTCTTGIYSKATNNCVNASGQPVGTPTYPASQKGRAACSPAAMASTWGNDATKMGCIAQGESSCGTRSAESSDHTTDGYLASAGLYQINMSANQIMCPDQPPLNCPKAFSSALAQSNPNVTVVDPVLYDKCLKAALNNDCNTNTAKYLLNNTPRGIKNWSTAGQCGY